MSLLVPGLGQAWKGQPLRGILFHLGELGLALGLLIGGLFHPLGFPGLVLSFSLVLAWHWGVALDAGRWAPPARALPRWGGVAAVLALALLGDAAVAVAILPRSPAQVWIYRTGMDSMVPAILAGETVLAHLTGPVLPRRGDVVVIADPEGVLLLKRVAGLPGETVEIRDGSLRIDGRPVPWTGLPQAGAWPGNGPASVPADAVFVLGDNLGHSRDSRHFGALSVEAILGRVLYVVRSPDWRRIGRKVSSAPSRTPGA